MKMSNMQIIWYFLSNYQPPSILAYSILKKEIKKKCRPTYPLLFFKTTGNEPIFFFWPHITVMIFVVTTLVNKVGKTAGLRKCCQYFCG